MPAYIIKSVSMDKDAFDYICDVVDGKDKAKKDFSKAFNYTMHKHIAMEKEIIELRKKLLLQSDDQSEVNVRKN